ncbi:dihydrolipoamide acetyltransferase family protein [Ramlibacter solisilvae]|uniref:Dihydrolipoamide acetyltransferase component of pyruvate dehydrogenase complex n=1 Tax=Ramlibacter tataouinensis TaxID=94132 RepID=A0A127JPM6_9BURK|nr:dihydrolipoamide acetyltransferase family protein [Ramlibacter tataouinensis]AMO21889.1 branched-chain alpha-keto acid dehydrogenase subunit E2 [Ramlibacter tataouinensis]
MGTYVIRTPDIGEGIAEVELVAWHVKPGDMVKEDQVLADVMTDKATVEIPSPVTGKVMELVGEVGQQVAVGSDLIRLEVEGAGNVKAGAVAAAAAAPAAQRPHPNPPPEGEGTGTAPPREMEAAKTDSLPHRGRAGVGALERPPTSAPVAQRAPGEKPIASPAVRRRAWELGIELQFVHGSGPAGKITHEDLDVYLASRGQPMAGRAAATAYAQRSGETEVPVIGLRRKIAQKMQEAKRRIPHFSYVEEIDVTELEALRARLNAKYAAERGKLTVLPLLARAVVLAVRDFPQMNARFDDDAGVVTRYNPVHLGLAAQTPSGLMVPVMRHAETLDLWDSAREIARLAEAARTGKAARDELSGSTITITSLGALGGIVTTPVINHPEVAIIGVNRIVERPMFRNGLVVARQMMNLSSSFDHRVVDGMDAAEFIQAIRALLEAPAMLFVE